MKGCYTALITPFCQGQVDFDSLSKLIDFQIDGGIHGVIPCGTTGESPTLSHEEHREVIKFTIEKVRKENVSRGTKVKVVAGSGSNSTAESLSLSLDAEKFGADGLLVVAPYYNKPTQGGLLAHYGAIAEAVETEVVVYNVPGRSGVLIEPQTFNQLFVSHKNINTLKDAVGDIDHTSDVLHLSPEVDLLSGNDSMNLPIYALGGVGCISVLSNLFPRETVELLKLVENNEMAEARKLHYKRSVLVKALFAEVNPIPVKKACHLMGLIKSDEIRLPLLPPSVKLVNELADLLK